ncbi:MAG TPA: hypothetical protein ENK43_16055 [Planctomycetes bacterium]|nr:hypothetical protein [Planctomycetota bacterium]
MRRALLRMGLWALASALAPLVLTLSDILRSVESPVSAERLAAGAVAALTFGALTWMALMTARGLRRVYLRRGWHLFLVRWSTTALVLAAPLWLPARAVVAASHFAGRPSETWAMIGLACGLAVGLSLPMVLIEKIKGRRWQRGMALALIAAAGTAVNLKVYAAQYPLIHLLVAFTVLGSCAGALVAWLPARRGGAILGALMIAIMIGVGASGLGEGATGYGPLPRVEGFIASLSPFATTARKDEADPKIIEGLWGQTVSGRREELLGAGPPPPRIVLITIDTLRAKSTGFLGHPGRPTTPFLDRLAERSVVFERAYAQACHSLASILSLFTGRYPAALNHYRRLHGGRPEVSEPSLAGTLAAHGFRTVGIPSFKEESLAGKFREFGKGFQTFERPKGAAPIPSADKVTASALGVLRGARPDEKLFLWMHFMEVHGPHDAIPPRFGNGPLALYEAAIRRVDDALGAFWQTAEREGLFDNALVIVHADHGEEFFEHGGRYHGTTLYEEVIHVPLFLWKRGLTPRRAARPVELVDLMPTILDIEGLTPLAPLHGDSLVPEILGEDREHIALAQMKGGSAWLPDRSALVETRFKIIAQEDFSRTEFFDLVEDPNERQPEGPGIPKSERRRLEDRLRAAMAIAREIPAGRVEAGEPKTAQAWTRARIEQALQSDNLAEVNEALDALSSGNVEEYVSLLGGLLDRDGAAATNFEIQDRVLRILESLEPTGEVRDTLWDAARKSIPTPLRQRILDALRKSARPDDLARLAFLPEKERLLETLLFGAALGREDAKQAILAALASDTGALFYRAAPWFAGDPRSPFRHALVALCAAFPPRGDFAAYALDLLAKAEDPVVQWALPAVREHPRTLAPFFDRAFLAQLFPGKIPLTDGVRKTLYWIATDDGAPTPVRSDAMALLARVGSPREYILRRDAEVQARPVPHWSDLTLTPAAGSLLFRSLGLPGPMLSWVLRWESKTDANRWASDRLYGPIRMRADGEEIGKSDLLLEANGPAHLIVPWTQAAQSASRITLLAPDGTLLGTFPPPVRN